MEKVFSGDVSKLFMLLGGGVISLGTLWTRLIIKVRGSFKPYLLSTLLYLLVCMVIFSGVGFTFHPAFVAEPASHLVFCQAFFLLFGSGHLYLMHRYLQWSGDAKSMVPELVFTVATALFGSLFFMILYRLFNRNGLEYMMAGSAVFFIIPFFFYHSFLLATGIPAKIRKPWFYPLHEAVEEPDDSKLRNLLVISFEFEKQAGDQHLTNFRAKAPADMDFSQLFYYFINDYNERHPNGKIQYTSSTGDPHAWAFYKKPRWYAFQTQYIDADKTIYNNRIRENDVIICTRSLN